MTQRDALKKIYQAVIVVGAANFFSFEDLLALDSGVGAIDKPNLIWLHGSSCSGCSTSFLNVADMPLIDILTQYTNVIFHPDISLATGHEVVEILDKVDEYKNNLLLVVEGSIPVKMPHACMMGEEPISHWIGKIASKSSVAISAGTCASYGGITTMKGMVTGCATLPEFLNQIHADIPVVNLPNCPMKPEHLLYTLFYYIKMQTLPKLDKDKRPVRFYAKTIHERCNLHDDFMRKKFAKFIGDEGCLYELGCQGIVTKNDCPINGHNDNTNICIRAGHPCIGCAGKYFPRQIMLKSYNDKRFNYNFKAKVQ